MERQLRLQGSFNTRDLGGLPTGDGRHTVPGRMVRSDLLDHLTAADWRGLWGLTRYPQVSAQVLAAIAQAPPGGVLLHCVSGRDRTGLITLLLLSLAGVSADDIGKTWWIYRDRWDALACVFKPGPRGLVVADLVLWTARGGH